jgi:hypothetical protein
MADRRIPPPWTFEEADDAYFVVNFRWIRITGAQ